MAHWRGWLHLLRDTRMTRPSRRRVAIVTGAGRGLGRAYALALADSGHAVVVNDRGAAADGVGADATPSEQVVAEIIAAGGEAVASSHDVTSFDDMAHLVALAVDYFGDLDVVVTNAGILRDRMLVSMPEDAWDDVVAVHLKGTFTLTHHAAAHWRARSKAGESVSARLITTTSASGLYGNVGQANYGAAKAGIAAFTLIAGRELAAYGVSANCIAPSALTRLTERPLAAMEGSLGDERRDELDPRWVARVVAWLCSPEAAGVSGHVFDVRGRQVGIAEGWHLPATISQPDDDDALAAALTVLAQQAAPGADMEGRRELVAVGGAV